VPTEGGSPVAGIAWAVVDPHHPAKALRSALLRAPGNNHLLFPYMAVRPGGQGVVSLSMSGPDMHPSPAYAVLSKEGLGQLTVITPGVGVLESFSGYKNFSTAHQRVWHLLCSCVGCRWCLLGGFWVCGAELHICRMGSRHTHTHLQWHTHPQQQLGNPCHSCEPARLILRC
jgi:hypothetical protein